MERIRVTPVRVKIRDEQARCDVLRGVGFRAEVPGGWRGPVRRTRAEAMVDKLERQETHA